MVDTDSVTITTVVAVDRTTAYGDVVGGSVDRCSLPRGLAAVDLAT